MSKPHPPFHDLSGRRFGRLVAIRPIRLPGKQVRYECVCDCGRVTTPLAGNLRRDKALSCGCFMIDRTKEVNTKHGMEGTRTYRTWHGIKVRCDWRKSQSYPRYGGRGISYDPRWKDFSAFFADMGEAPEGMQIDRIDNDGNYCKENCRWITPRENASNRGNNNIVDYQGERITWTELARRLNMKPITLETRLRRLGWSLEKAIATPVRNWKRRAVIAAVTLLGACAQLPNMPPEVRTQTVSVKIPVAVPCFTEDQRPVQPIPTPVDPETASTEQLAAAELADAVAWRDYAAAVDLLFLACQQKGMTP